MNINSINGTTNALTASTNAQTKTEKPSERDMFMTLLVAQLKNQDPLEPQDGAAFVAQLAQFNSLDQLVGIRQSIDKLNTAIQQTPDQQTA